MESVNTSNNEPMYSMEPPPPYGSSTDNVTSSGNLRGVLLVHLEPVRESDYCAKFFQRLSEGPVSDPRRALGLEGSGTIQTETGLSAELRAYQASVKARVYIELNAPDSGSSCAMCCPCLEGSAKNNLALEGRWCLGSRGTVKRTEEVRDRYEYIAASILESSDYGGRIRFEVTTKRGEFDAAVLKLRPLIGE